MKKLSLLMAAAVVGMSASAATVYFDKTGCSWSEVWAYSWSPEVTAQAEAVTIDGHSLYAITTSGANVIFKAQQGWNGDANQTGDLQAADGAVYGSASIKSNGGSGSAIAKIVDNKWVAQGKDMSLYVKGTVNGWGIGEDWKFTTTDNVTYNWTGTIASGAQFKIGCSDWNDASWGPKDSNKSVSANETVTLTNNTSSKNLVATEAITKLSLNTSTGVLTIGNGGSEVPDEPIITPPSTDYPAMYLVGNMTGWSKNDDYVMTTTDGVTYTLAGQNFKTTDEFKFFGGAWGTRELTADVAVMPNTEYSVAPVSGNVNMRVAEALSDVTIKLVCSSDYTSGTVTFITEGTVVNPPTTEYPELYLVGGITGWEVKDAYKMTREGDIYSITLADGITSGSWKIGDASKSNSGWDINYGAGADTEPESGAWVEAVADGQNFTLNTTGSTTVKFNYASNEVCVIYGNGGVEDETWYVSYGANDDSWVFNTAMPKNSEGLYEATIKTTDANGTYVTFATGEFENWTLTSGTRYGASSKDLEAESNTTYNLVSGTENCFKLGEGTWKLTVESTATAKKVTITNTTGVAAIDAEEGVATYYNLQGVRVNNPENGIFIRVANGKSMKVAK